MEGPHRECTVHRFLPETPLLGATVVTWEGGSCRRIGLMFSVGLTPVADTHVAAVVDGVGRVVGSESFAADESGYGRMVAWFRARGALVRVGVEGCGSYGAGLARYLTRRRDRGGGGQPP